MRSAGRRLPPRLGRAAWRVGRTDALQGGLAYGKPHDFRCFVGTELANRAIRQAQQALGHTRIETTAKHDVLDELEVGLTDALY